VRTAEERIAALHGRMRARRRTRERIKTALTGAAGIISATCLLIVFLLEGKAIPDSSAGMYSGAMMLFGDAGGYVLVAVVSFALAVIITVVCFRRQGKQKDGKFPADQRKTKERSDEE